MSFVPENENENKVHPCGFPMDNVFSPTLNRCMSVAPTPMDHSDDEDYEYVDDEQQYFTTSPGLTRSMTFKPPTLTRSMSVAPAPMDYSDDEDDCVEEYFAAPAGLTRSMSTAPHTLTRSMTVAPEPMDIELDLSDDEQYFATPPGLSRSMSTSPPGLTISTSPTSFNSSENVFEIPSPVELTRGVNVAQYYMGNIPSLTPFGFKGSASISMDVDVGVDVGVDVEETEKEA